MFSRLFSGTSTGGKVPSFDDFSMGAGNDAEELRRGSVSSDDAEGGSSYRRTASLDSSHGTPPRSNVWQSVFNPNTNFSKAMNSRDYYDHVTHGAPTTWQYIAKADHLKQLSFANLDKNGDGFVDADELRAALGPQADVQHLISQADKNKDGKISYFEFCELLKHS